MITPELISFIKSELAKGKLQEQIRSELATGGWTASDLEEAFSFILKIPVQPIQTVKPVQPIQSPITQPITPITPIAQSIQPITPIQQTQPLQPIIQSSPITPIQATPPLQPISQIIQPIQTGFVSANSPISSKPKPHSKVGLFFVIFLIIFGGAFAGWYFFKPEVMKIIGGNNDEIIKEVKTENPKALPIQTNFVKIISPLNGDEIISGSELVIQYEILQDISEDVLPMINGLRQDDSSEPCGTTLENKTKGIYSLICKVDSDKLGPTQIMLLEMNRTVGGIENKEINLEIIAPSDIQPVDIVLEDELFAIVQNPAPYVVAQIKYSDGSLRDIPFVYLNYTLDDPTLIYFLYTDEKSYAQHYIAYKSGTTTLHAEYKGIKKDFPVVAEGFYPEGRVPVRIDIGEEEQKIIDSIKNPVDKCVANNTEYYFHAGETLDNGVNQVYDRSGKLIADCPSIRVYNSTLYDSSAPSADKEHFICKDISKALELQNCQSVS
ncbi:MAG: Protein kinase family protein [Patescibacteria group bacterium]|nr:Protein kinase family protein [Patescibacteria group bacterium]